MFILESWADVEITKPWFTSDKTLLNKSWRERDRDRKGQTVLPDKLDSIPSVSKYMLYWIFKILNLWMFDLVFRKNINNKIVISLDPSWNLLSDFIYFLSSRWWNFTILIKCTFDFHKKWCTYILKRRGSYMPPSPNSSVRQGRGRLPTVSGQITTRLRSPSCRTRPIQSIYWCKSASFFTGCGKCKINTG